MAFHDNANFNESISSQQSPSIAGSAKSVCQNVAAQIGWNEIVKERFNAPGVGYSLSVKKTFIHVGLLAVLVIFGKRPHASVPF